MGSRSFADKVDGPLPPSSSFPYAGFAIRLKVSESQRVFKNMTPRWAESLQNMVPPCLSWLPPSAPGSSGGQTSPSHISLGIPHMSDIDNPLGKMHQRLGTADALGEPEGGPHARGCCAAATFPRGRHSRGVCTLGGAEPLFIVQRKYIFEFASHVGKGPWRHAQQSASCSGMEARDMYANLLCLCRKRGGRAGVHAPPTTRSCTQPQAHPVQASAARAPCTTVRSVTSAVTSRPFNKHAPVALN